MLIKITAIKKYTRSVLKIFHNRIGQFAFRIEHYVWIYIIDKLQFTDNIINIVFNIFKNVQ